MKKRNGFTLVEILIVVVILGILAAIVIPQFSSASEDAKLSTLVSDLQTIRSQVQLYKLQHNGTLAGLTTGATFVTSMTGYTDTSGATVAAGAAGALGPYIQKVPANPFDSVSTVTVNTDAPDTTGGWHFNPTTGAFTANDDGSSNGTAHILY